LPGHIQGVSKDPIQGLPGSHPGSHPGSPGLPGFHPEGLQGLPGSHPGAPR
ncbi:58 kDa phosphoprotein-like, partial [Manacus vitellinus]|uniref:58 kDa phosphoprotein-like n=1 Tax=Manacus vitellinus TaxID=328815 RepID=UPI00115CE34A